MKNARPVSKEQAFLHQVQYILFPRKQKPDTEKASAFMEVERIIPDEEIVVFSKPVVHFSFTYSVLRGLL